MVMRQPKNMEHLIKLQSSSMCYCVA
uniref:Uncharacterized protein n=1 Tax=Rhizophora mucronata TaxID=61149 RepID=A0A2P2PD01_RHIMU